MNEPMMLSVVSAPAVAWSVLLGIISPACYLVVLLLFLLPFFIKFVDGLMGGSATRERFGRCFHVFWLCCLIARNNIVNALLHLRILRNVAVNRLLTLCALLIVRGDKLAKVVRFFVAIYFRIHKSVTVMPNVQNSATPDVRCQPRMRN